MIRLTTLLLCCASFAQVARGDAILFDLAGSSGLSGEMSGSITISGITANILAGGSETPTLKASEGNFGIASNVHADDFLIDSTDVLTLTFSQSVTFNSLTVGDLRMGEGFAIDFPGFSTNGNGGENQTFTFDVEIGAGQQIQVRPFSEASNFYFQSFSVTAVPEPSSHALITLFCVLGLRRRQGARVASPQNSRKRQPYLERWCGL